jgi:hypothetical protein
VSTIWRPFPDLSSTKPFALPGGGHRPGRREAMMPARERSHRIAFASLKHSFEKVGDHWEEKATKGPSDPQAAKSGAAARRGNAGTAGGVDMNASKKHLYELAQRLGVKGRSTMDKKQLVEAIRKANDRKTAKARKR